jgi:hypothetical protein
MNRIWWAAVVWVCAVIPASRAATPLDAPLPEGKTTTIECEYVGNDSIPALGKADKGIFHYKVYVPTGYGADPTRRYPCMFIMSAGGNAGIGRAGNCLKSAEWIVVMLVEARNGPWGPVIGNFCAAHDDAVKRLRIAEGQKFATGFSGGSRGSSTIIYLRRGFAGLWLQGAGLASDDNHQYLRLPRALAVFASFGSWDGNARELTRVREMFSTFAFELFDAGHAAAPADEAGRAFDWLEEQLYLNSPQANVTPAQAARFFQRRHEAMRAAPAGWTKYHYTVVLQEMAARYRLASIPSVAALVPEVAGQLRQMESDPGVRAEKAAHDAYLLAQSRELLEQTGGGQDKPSANIPSHAIAAYQQIARQYPDTEYGRLATARAAALANGRPAKQKKDE